VDSLPPTQYLILEVLAARRRTGERTWTFPDRLRRQIDNLSWLGLVGWKFGVAQRSVQAWLTAAGQSAILSPNYQPPEPVGRERIARYLDRAAANQRRTGLLADAVTANAWEQAARWCRDDTIWDDGDEEQL
jgi:hypothetical protein